MPAAAGGLGFLTGGPLGVGAGLSLASAISSDLNARNVEKRAVEAGKKVEQGITSALDVTKAAYDQLLKEKTNNQDTTVQRQE